MKLKVTNFYRKIKRGSPFPFVLSKDMECLFLIGNNKAYSFTFSNHVLAVMGLNYFYAKHAKQVEIPLRILKDIAVAKHTLLATKVEGSSNYCHVALTNN